MDDDAIIRRYYEDPRHGLFGAAKLAKTIRRDHPEIRATDVARFVARQPTAQINREVHLHRRDRYNAIVAFAPNDVWQADLLDVQNLSGANKNYRYILNVIDVYSRHLWSFPLKSKSATEVAAALAGLIDEVGAPRNFTSDHGKEFLNSSVQGLLEENGVKVYLHEVGDHNVLGIVERVNRTVRELFRKWFAMKGTKVWLDVHGDLIANYNEAVHSTTKQRPVDVYTGAAYPDAVPRRRNVPQFHAGDRVRLRTVRNTFDKPEERWSRILYTVVQKVGKTYELQNEKGDVLSRRYKPDMMQKVAEGTESAAPPDETAATVRKQARDRKVALLNKQAGVEAENILREGSKRDKKTPAKFRDFVAGS